LFDGKKNLVGTFGRSKFPKVFKSAQHKNEGKTGIFRQNRFSAKSILVFGVTLKQMTVDALHFH